jgi:hypothetical protein
MDNKVFDIIDARCNLKVWHSYIEQRKRHTCDNFVVRWYQKNSVPESCRKIPTMCPCRRKAIWTFQIVKKKMEAFCQ